MAQVKFMLDADTAKAVQEVLKVVGAVGKATDASKRLGSTTVAANQAAGKSVADLRLRYQEMASTQQLAAARSLVATIQNRTQGNANLALTQTGRALANSSNSAISSQIQDIQLQRFLAARRIREERAAKLAAAADKATEAAAAAPAAMTSALRVKADTLKKTATEAQQISGMAIGWITGALGSITGIIRAGVHAAEKIEAERQGAAGRTQAAAMDVNKLRQVISPAEAPQMTKVLEELRISGFMDTSEAANVGFGIKSVGLLNDPNVVPTLARSRRLGIAPDTLLGAFATVKANYGAGFGLEDVGAKTMAAAGDAAKADMSQFAAGIGGAASMWKSIGGTLDEQLAFMSVAADAKKNVDVGTEKINSLASALNRTQDQIAWGGEKKLTGLALLDKLPELEKAGRLLSKSGEAVNIRDFLGDSGAMEALQIYQANAAEIRARQKRSEATKGGEGSIFRIQAGIRLGPNDAGLAFLSETQKSQIAMENAESALTNWRDTFMLRRRTKNQMDSPFWTNTIGDFIDWGQKLDATKTSEVLDTLNIAKLSTGPDERAGVFADLSKRLTDTELRKRIGTAQTYIGLKGAIPGVTSKDSFREEVTAFQGELSRRKNERASAALAGIEAGMEGGIDAKAFNEATQALRIASEMMAKIYGGEVKSPARFTPSVHR